MPRIDKESQGDEGIKTGTRPRVLCASYKKEKGLCFFHSPFFIKLPAQGLRSRSLVLKSGGGSGRGAVR